MAKGKQIPLAVGQIVQLEIEGLTSSGEGVGRHQGFTVFVPGALPGDRVEAKVISLKPNYGRALPSKLLRESEQRVAPLCPVYEACGACQLQHFDYEAQLEYKRQWVVDALERIGKLKNITVHPTLPMEEPWRYRNKAQFPVGLTDGRIIAGCYRRRTHQIVDIDDCFIQHPLSARVLQVVKELAATYGLSIYDEQTGKGLLRHVLVRVGFHTGEVLAVLVTTGEPFEQGKELAAHLMREVPELVGVVRNINDRRTNVVLGDKAIPLAGRDYLIDQLGGLKFRISARSFYQVNPLQTEVLYQKTLDYAGLTGEETVIDAYCGIGTISLFLARQAKQVIGIEIVEAAVHDARRNAAINNIDNAEFIVGEAEKIMPRLYKEGLRPHVIVVDPPRAGCAEPLLEAIVNMQPQRVVYVSCNPTTLARDLAYLSQQGFRVQEVQPVDMFPHTGHVETVVLMSKL
ncbi:MAG: 23S rRNA (uracil(1939)-C(5))-methyltransferase RlmD [Firmicutes bacterium]|nr:23S rRNA (uracil(1939)-C(5))-methyltransferase RlmD [Bacillota bacterium]